MTSQSAFTSPTNPSSLKSMLFFAFLLITITSASLYAGFVTIQKIQELLSTEFSVFWKMPSYTELKSGSILLHYHQSNNSIKHIGPISQVEKEKILTLITSSSKKEQDNKKAVQEFTSAIDELTYQSNLKNREISGLTLLLGGIIGLIGAMVRSMNNFIGVACFKRELNLTVWWPWYILRPFIGVVLGSLIITMSQSNFFFSSEAVAKNIFWWASASFIAGFGSSDFLEKLRLISQTFFGSK